MSSSRDPFNPDGIIVVLLFLLTSGFVLLSMAIAYARSRDPLHPLIYIGPMLLYVYVARPWLLYVTGQLQVWFPDSEKLLFSQFLYSIGTGLFCLGALWGGRGHKRHRLDSLKFTVSDRVGRNMSWIGCILGTVSVCAYCYAVFSSGGFAEVYGSSKAYVSAGSGWINELVNLSIPSVAFLLLSWQGKSRHWQRFALALTCCSPLLVHGLLGARRGPTFMILSAMLVSWYLATSKRVSVFKVLTRFGAIGLLVIVLMSHRTDIYLGSDFEFDFAKVMENLAPSKVNEADDTVFQYGFVNGIREHERYLWGVRYFADYFVRPIPRQIWPTKYADIGLGWMVNQSDIAGLTNDEWRDVLGWVPTRGSAAGFVADLFFEFSYFGLIGCWLFGWFFGVMWRRAHVHRGLSILLYIELAALSIYVPTQSVSAVLYRFLFMLLFTWLIWWLLMNPERTDLRAVDQNAHSGLRYIIVRAPQHDQTTSRTN